MFMAICTALELKDDSMMALTKRTKILPAQIFFAGQDAIKHFTLLGFSKGLQRRKFTKSYKMSNTRLATIVVLLSQG
jgi:hypothetical protein